jgi:hypothetical protein
MYLPCSPVVSSVGYEVNSGQGRDHPDLRRNNQIRPPSTCHLTFGVPCLTGHGISYPEEGGWQSFRK